MTDLKRVRAAVLCLVLIAIASLVIPTEVYAADSPVIDGYFDDWEDKPKTKITYGSTNGTVISNASMIKDDDYIYIYVQLHPGVETDMLQQVFYLSINGKQCTLFTKYANDRDTIDWSRPVSISSKGTYTDLHPFTHYPDYSLGDAVIVNYGDNTWDSMEMRIDIDKLESVNGLSQGSINSGAMLELHLVNIGAQKIQLMGTSTGGVIGIALCLVAVILIKVIKDRKRLAQ